MQNYKRIGKKPQQNKKNMEMDVSADIVPLPASEKTMVEVVVKTVRKDVNPDRKKKQTKEIMPKQNLPQSDEQEKPKSATQRYCSSFTAGII